MPKLTRKYGAALCYTPMYNSKLWAAAGEGSGTKGEFYTVPEDRPLLVQVRVSVLGWFHAFAGP